MNFVVLVALSRPGYGSVKCCMNNEYECVVLCALSCVQARLAGESELCFVERYCAGIKESSCHCRTKFERRGP